MWEWLAFVALGAAVGFAGGYAGIGGAPFLVVGLALLLGYDQHVAQGTVLAVMLGPMSLPAVIVMWDRVKLLKREIFIGVACYAIISYFGAQIAYAMDAKQLQILFGAFLFALGLRYVLKYKSSIFSTSESADIENTPIVAELNPNGPTVLGGVLPFTIPIIVILSCIKGAVGGMFGIGAGVLMVPAFISLCGLHKDDARALSLAILLPPVSIGAALEYEANDGIVWPTALVIFVVYFATNAIGAKLGRKHDTSQFLFWLGALLSAIAAVLIGKHVLP